MLPQLGTRRNFKKNREKNHLSGGSNTPLMEFDVQREQMGLLRRRQPSDSSRRRAIKFHSLNFPTRPGWQVSD